MDQKILQDGMSEPCLDMLLNTLPDGSGRYNGRRMAILMIEALRANYAFYDSYAGYLDVLQAIAVFANRGPMAYTKGSVDNAGRCLAEAGWREQKIAMVQDGLMSLEGSEQSFDNLAGDMRSLRGGLMVVRDVWVVPLFLPKTCGHAESQCLAELVYDLTTPEDTPEELRAQAWKMMQDWYHVVLCKLEHGEWKSLGWSCIYESQLDGLDERELVRQRIREDQEAKPFEVRRCLQCS